MILRLRPDLVVGMPVAFATLRFAFDTPKILLQIDFLRLAIINILSKKNTRP